MDFICPVCGAQLPIKWGDLQDHPADTMALRSWKQSKRSQLERARMKYKLSEKAQQNEDNRDTCKWGSCCGLKKCDGIKCGLHVAKPVKS